MVRGHESCANGPRCLPDSFLHRFLGDLLDSFLHRFLDDLLDSLREHKFQDLEGWITRERPSLGSHPGRRRKSVGA